MSALVRDPYRQPDVEEWRAIAGYEGIYEVSSEGRIRRLADRFYRCTRPLAVPAIVTPKKAGKGYMAVMLSKDGVKVQHYIHRLVLIAFVNNPGGRFVGAHQDNSTDNNWLSNLRWKSQAGNLNDRHRHGTIPQGEGHHNAKLTEAAVKAIRSSKARSAAEARKYNVSPRLIRMVRAKEIWTHV